MKFFKEILDIASGPQYTFFTRLAACVVLVISLCVLVGGPMVILNGLYQKHIKPIRRHTCRG